VSKRKEEKWYLLRKEEKELLESLGIEIWAEIDEIEIEGRRVIEKVIAFPAPQEKEKLERLLLGRIEVPTIIENLFYLKKGEKLVEIEKKEKSYLLKEILEEVALEEGLEIVFHNPHGERAEPIFDGRLHIFNWSVPPERKAEKGYLPEVFGVYLEEGRQGDAFLVKEIPFGVLFDEAGVIFGEIYGEGGLNLYIYFDLAHGNNCPELMKKIIEKWKERREEKTFLKDSTVKELLKHFFLRKIEKERKVAEEKVRKAKRDYQEIVEKLREVIEEIEREERRLLALENFTEEAQKEIEKEIEFLFSIPEVKNISILGEKLIVETYPIEIEFAGGKYNLGEYLIEIDEERGEIRIKGSRNPKPEADHPHVKAGDPCLGNIKGKVYKLLADYRYGMLVQLLIEFLKSYNPDDKFFEIGLWKRKEKEKEDEG